MKQTTSRKPGRPRNERTEGGTPASTEPLRQRIQIHLDPTHPIERGILEAYNSRQYYPDGGDYIAGIDVLRRALVLGWGQLVSRNPGAYPTAEGANAPTPEAPARVPAASAAGSASSPPSSRISRQAVDEEAFGSAPV